MTEHTDGIPGMTPGQTAPGTEPVTGQEWPYYAASPKMVDNIDLDKEPPLEMDPMYAHLERLYDKKQPPEHTHTPPGPEDKLGTAPVPNEGTVRTVTRNGQKIPKKAAPATETDVEHATGHRLGEKLRFEDGRLWFGDGDAPGRTVYEVTDDGLRRATELDVSRLQPFYDTVMAETADPETETDMDRVYGMKLTPPPVSPDDANEPQPCLEDMIDDARSDILYGSGFACAASGPWKDCRRLLEYVDYDRDTGEVRFAAPFFGELAVAMGQPDAEAADEPAKEREDGTAKGYRVTETAIRKARSLTPTKLRRVAPDRFRFVQKAGDGTVMFAGPLPPPYDEGLTYETADDGSTRMSEDEFHRFEDAWEKYALTLPECRRRTEVAAGETTALVNDIALITDKLYRHALTPIQNDNAFIMPIGMADDLHIEDGASGKDEFTFSLEECDSEDIAKLDFALLATVYSIILNKLERKVEEARDPDEVLRILEDPDSEYVVKLFLPKFLEMIGSKPNDSEDHFKAARNKLESFKDVVGIHATKDRYGTHYRRFSVMGWNSYDDETNHIRFSSPYCNHIASLLLRKHLKTDKRGNLQMPPGGPPAMTVSHSYALNTVLASELNKPAVEIVCYVAYLVETAGRAGGTPRATARTIVKECPTLRHRMAKEKTESGKPRTTSDKNKDLKRAFEKAWQILADPKYSDLAKRHKDFQVPTKIPKMQELDNIVYQFSSKAGPPEIIKPSKTTRRKRGS